jgi:hypothetical protein
LTALLAAVTLLARGVRLWRFVCFVGWLGQCALALCIPHARDWFAPPPPEPWTFTITLSDGVVPVVQSPKYATRDEVVAVERRLDARVTITHSRLLAHPLGDSPRLWSMGRCGCVAPGAV